MIFKALNGLGLGYLKYSLSPYDSTIVLRSSKEAFLHVLWLFEVRSEEKWKRAFSVVAPSLWNLFLQEVQYASVLS